MPICILIAALFKSSNAFIAGLNERYASATKVRLVMDNLNTQNIASLYETFEPNEARRLAERLDIHYTPKHGSWLNMAEIELGVLKGQCLDRRIPDMAIMQTEVDAWERDRYNRATVELGMNEFRTKVFCINNISTRRKPKVEEKEPRLLADIIEIMNPQSQGFCTTLLLEHERGFNSDQSS